MQSLANPEIGGFFDIVQEGQGGGKAKTIIGLVRARFNAMWLIHWTVSCINSSVEQTFNLVFENTKPVIAPDGTFKDVPIGIDPTQWPLDVDVAKTTKAAQDNPLYPGGQFTVYGDFCWSGDKTRAESYFIPAGTNPSSAQTNSRDPAVAKQAMQQLQIHGAAAQVQETQSKTIKNRAGALSAIASAAHKGFEAHLDAASFVREGMQGAPESDSESGDAPIAPQPQPISPIAVPGAPPMPQNATLGARMLQPLNPPQVDQGALQAPRRPFIPLPGNGTVRRKAA